jgi:hypothetical protein
MDRPAIHVCENFLGSHPRMKAVVSTGREVVALHDELIWPEKIVRGDSDHDRSV